MMTPSQNGHDRSHTVEHGIERIVYTPRDRKYRTPILMQHGMWHGAWCWEPWQKLFADWGWESHAYSLPGHGRSPSQRPSRWCTLGYYDRFLAEQVVRMPVVPVLMGHSMGGALVQRYLKYRGEVPAAVLVASWPSRNALVPTATVCRRHPLIAFKTFASLSASHAVRTPQLVKRFFLSDDAMITAEDLHTRLSPESILVVLQHQPLFWRPPVRTRTPLLWLAGTEDYLTAERLHRASAADYGAAYIAVPGANHDLMWEKSFQETASSIHRWLVDRALP